MMVSPITYKFLKMAFDENPCDPKLNVISLMPHQLWDHLSSAVNY